MHINLKRRNKIIPISVIIIICVENPEKYAKNNLKLKHEFSKVIKYKVKAQNTIIFQYSSNGWNKNIKIMLF